MEYRSTLVHAPAARHHGAEREGEKERRKTEGGGRIKRVMVANHQ